MAEQIKKELVVTAELKEGVSTKTNNPYRFYAFSVIVNGIPVALRPENPTAGKLLEVFLDSQT